MSPRARKRIQRAYARTAFREHTKRRLPGSLHTIASFCASNAISESYYYSLKRRGLQPREIDLDGLVRITPEAERDWRAEREAATTARREHQREQASQDSTTTAA